MQLGKFALDKRALKLLIVSAMPRMDRELELQRLQLCRAAMTLK